MAEPARPTASYRRPIVQGYYRFNLPQKANKEEVEKFVALFRQIYKRLSSTSVLSKAEVLER